MKIVEGNLAVDKSKKVAIINARFNHFITDRLVEGAKDERCLCKTRWKSRGP